MRMPSETTASVSSPTDETEERVCRQRCDDRYAWASSSLVTEVAATLGTFHAYARRDHACWQSAPSKLRRAVAIAPIRACASRGARRLLRLSRLLRPRYAFATNARASAPRAGHSKSPKCARPRSRPFRPRSFCLHEVPAALTSVIEHVDLLLPTQSGHRLDACAVPARGWSRTNGATHPTRPPRPLGGEGGAFPGNPARS